MNHLRAYTSILFQLLTLVSVAQETKIDSLKTILRSAGDGSPKVSLLNDLSEVLLNTKPAEAIAFATEAKFISENIHYQAGMADAYRNIGLGHFMQSKYIDCVTNLSRSMEIYNSIGDHASVANILTHLGYIYHILGDEPQAIRNYMSGLNILEQLGDTRRIGSLLINIGDIYSNQIAQMDSALYYFSKGLQLGESSGNMDLIGLSIIHLGQLYFTMEDYDSALYYFDKSLSVISSNVDFSTSLNYLGKIYAKKKDFQNAIQYHHKALDMAKAEYSSFQIVRVLISMATTYHLQGDQRKAIDYYEQAKSLAQEIESNPELAEAYRGLASSYAELSDFKNAYIFSTLQNQLYLANAQKESDHLKYLLLLYSSHEKDRDEQIDVLEQQSLVEQLKNRRQRILIITSGFIGFLMLLLIAGLLHRFQYIRRTNMKMQKQKDEIEKQRDEIEIQRDLLIRQKRELTDSITYAQRIQDALLPSDDYIKGFLSEYFIIYKPRDIVSGDFYWIKEFNNHMVVIGADCTGHGVPGGFMSMLGVTLLNDLITQDNLERPSIILERMRAKIKELLAQNGSYKDQKDGMDMAIAVLDRTRRKLIFAGANHPIYLVRNNVKLNDAEMAPFLSMKNNNYSLFEFKGDNQPIGAHWKEVDFKNQMFQLKEKDTLYIFSDGIIDQFGGHHRKKFKAFNFKKLLLSVQPDSMKFQKQHIEEEFIAWRGDFEQIDDVCVIGIRV